MVYNSHIFFYIKNMNKTLTYERFDSPFKLIEYVNKWNIKQEDIQQITGTDKGFLEDNNFTLFYWH